MPIDRVDGSGSFNRPEKLQNSENSERSPETSRSAGGDRIELSADATLAARLAAAADALPEVREQKIEALTNRLGRGAYHVDATRVARAILEFEDAFRR